MVLPKVLRVYRSTRQETVLQDILKLYCVEIKCCHSNVFGLGSDTLHII